MTAFFIKPNRVTSSLVYSTVLLAALVGLFFYPSSSLAQEENPYYGYERAPIQSQLVGRVSDFSGAFTNGFPIVVPPGRSGLQPDLQLQYNSQARDNANLFGYGWSINIPFIERSNKKGVEKLYPENFYYSSLSGELEGIFLSDGTHGTYGAKVEDGSFLKYEYNTDESWTIADKQGTVYKFGTTAASRQDDPADSSRVFKWMLEEVRDANGNFIRYEYFKDAGQIYPSKIIYTGNGTADGIFTVEFSIETRADNLKSYDTGFAVTTNYRIKEIQTKVNGTWVRKYVLTYTAGDNAVRSVLDTITESGQDESLNVIALPANNFDYQNRTPNWALESGLGTPAPFITSSNQDSGVRIADVNGDGLVDILRSVPAGSSVYLHNGSAWTLDANWSIPLVFVASNGNDAGTRLLDVNGDALVDLVQAESGSAYKVYINSGSGWTDESSSWSFPEPFVIGEIDAGTRLADINGDGLVDVLRATSTYQKVHLHNGSGWTENSSWVIPDPFIFNENNRDAGVRAADINGDRLADIVIARDSPSKYEVYINNGSGWPLDTSWAIPEPFLDGNKNDTGLRMAEANGDGFPDLVLDSGSLSRVYINSGTAWVLAANWVTPEPFITTNDVDAGTRLADFNGDGLIDIARNTGSIDRVYFANPAVADLLSHINHSKGAKEDIIYKSSAEFSNPNLPFVLQAVEKVTKDDSFGNLATTTHDYQGGKYYTGDIFDRKLAGFAQVTKTDPAGNKTKDFYHQGNATNSSQGEFADHVSKIGKVYRTEALDSVNNKYAQTIHQWENVDLGNNRDFVKHTQRIDFTFDGDASHRDTAETSTYENTYGNLTKQVTWGEVTGAENGTFTDIGSDKLTTDISYALNVTDYVVGLPSQEIVTDQSFSKVQETRHYYDGLALGSVTKGNETKQEHWVTGTTYVDTEKTYNSFGLVTSEKDPLDNATTYAYDPFNLYPARSTNAKNQTTQYTYDYATGKVKTTTDPNSRVFETVRDGFGRVVEQKVPDLATPTTLVTKAATTYTDTGMPRKVQTTQYLDATNSFDTIIYLDGFERKVQERKEAESTNNYAVKDFVYNELGLPEKESLPYFSTGSAYTTVTANNNLYTSFTYDALRRVKTIINAVGTSANAYSDWTTTVTDALGNSKDTTNDAYGRLVRVDEHEGVNTYTTSYEYSGLGNLTKLTDSASNIRNFTYDGLGRRLTAQDLHAPADATFGVWSYVYDVAGNLTQTTDSKGQAVNYTYDQLNRQLTEDFAGQAGTEITYVYDTGTNGIGRLASATTPDVTTAYTYNAVGGVAAETATIDSVNYVTEYDYDRQGNTTLIAYPDAAEVQYTYNTAGLLEKIETKESGGLFANVVSNFDDAPTGKVSFTEYANGTATTNTYDVNALSRLSNIKTTQPAGGQLGWATGLRRFSPLQLVLPETVYAQISPAPSGLCHQNIARDLEGKNARQKAILKAERMANCSYDGEFTSTKHGIRVEMKDFEKIEAEGVPGVEVLARAWKGDKQVGFGTDGSVEWERFRVFNPPILVDDLQGNIVRNETDIRGNPQVRTLREDPVEAMRQVISHNITLVGKGGSAIETGKVGNTVSTFYPDGDPESTTVDGLAGRDGVNETFSAVRIGAGTFALPSNAHGSPVLFASSTTNQYQDMRRAIHVYDSSALPDTDNINSATYSVYIDNKDNGLSGEASANSAWVAVGSTPASNTDVVAADYGQLGSTEYGRGVSQQSAVAGAYYDIALNATGQGAIDKAGVTRLGMRYGWDFDNTEVGLTWAPNGLQSMQADMADTVGTATDPKLVVEHSAPATNNAPGAPTSLQTEGLVNPVDIADATPEFSALYNDPDAGDTATDYQIQVSTASDFTTIFWDSLKTLLPTPATEGTRTADVSYAGDPLATQTTYYWRIKLWDDSAAEGAWSTETATFSIAATPNALQNISYTYDAVGNITQVVDASDTNAAKTVTYGYDDLYRITSAAATNAANGDNFSRTYVYDSIGNITSKSDVGTYLYAGTNYANPHAATSVNGVTYAYDNNGNLTDDGVRTYAWDYRNKVATIIKAATTHTYKYNHEGQRVSSSDGIATTIYPNKLYNTDGTKITKHIFDAEGNVIATVETEAGVTSTYYTHTDHLTGSNVVTDEAGNLEQALDYYPFGAIRLNDKRSTFDEQRKFTGQEYDADTNLHYYVQRYYNQDIGRFTSQDPVFLAAGTNNKLAQAALSNPQLLNSYSYTANNPLKYVDEQGEFPFLIVAAAVLGGVFLTDVEIAQAPDIGQTIDSTPWNPQETVIPNYSELSGPEQFGIDLGFGAIFGGIRGVGKEGIQNSLKGSANYFKQRRGELGKIFKSEGVQIHGYGLKRLAERESRGVTPEQVIDVYRTGKRYYDPRHNNINIIKDNIRLPLLQDQKTILNVIPEKKVNWDRFKPVE